jgi:hypothetical protein
MTHKFLAGASNPVVTFSQRETCSADKSMAAANSFCFMSSALRINRTSLPARRSGLWARANAAALANPGMSGMPIISSPQLEQRCTTTAFRTFTTKPPKSSTCSGFTLLSNIPFLQLQRIVIPFRHFLFAHVLTTLTSATSS